MINPRDALRRSPGRCVLVLSLVPVTVCAVWGVVDRVLDQLGVKTKT